MCLTERAARLPSELSTGGWSTGEDSDCARHASASGPAFRVRADSDRPADSRAPTVRRVSGTPAGGRCGVTRPETSAAERCVDG
jgi:hypothetical protein